MSNKNIIERNVIKCHGCVNSCYGQEGGHAGGDCICRVSGELIQIHIQDSSCPRGFHSDGINPPPIGKLVEIKVKPRKRPTLKMIAAWALAATLGKWASAEQVKERELICAKCDKLSKDEKGNYCDVCGCGLSGEEKAIRNLSAYQENLRRLPGYSDTLPEWGCKHPYRGKPKNPRDKDGEKFGWPLPIS